MKGVITIGMIIITVASLGTLGVYEPIHGSAPDIAGKGIANPLGAILSAAMLLRHSLKLETEAKAVEKAVEASIEAGAKTADLGGELSSEELGDIVVRSM